MPGGHDEMDDLTSDGFGHHHWNHPQYALSIGCQDGQMPSEVHGQDWLHPALWHGHGHDGQAVTSCFTAKQKLKYYPIIESFGIEHDASIP